MLNNKMGQEYRELCRKGRNVSRPELWGVRIGLRSGFNTLCMENTFRVLSVFYIHFITKPSRHNDIMN